MHAHRVEVLDRAHDDDVVEAVAHELELELVPAADGLLDEHLGDRGLRQAALHLAAKSRRIVCEAAPVATESERRAHDHWQRDAVELVERRHDARGGDAQAAGRHRAPELLTILRAPNHVDRGADELHAEVFEHTAFGKLDGEVERRLAAERREQRVRALPLEHGGDARGVERLDVGAVGEAGVGHDRRRVRVDDDRPVSVRAQHLERLAAGVVELARLADDDRARADDADALEVAARGH